MSDDDSAWEPPPPTPIELELARSKERERVLLVELERWKQAAAIQGRKVNEMERPTVTLPPATVEGKDVPYLTAWEKGFNACLDQVKLALEEAGVTVT